MLGLY